MDTLVGEATLRLSAQTHLKMTKDMEIYNSLQPTKRKLVMAARECEPNKSAKVW